jgi:hypothetical protein
LKAGAHRLIIDHGYSILSLKEGGLSARHLHQP